MTLASNLRRAKSVVSSFPILNLVQLRVHRLFTPVILLHSRGGNAGQVDQLQTMSNLPNDFDQVAVVVDWLDACRTRNLDALLGLYAEAASLECKCDDGLKVHQGHAELASYWQPRFSAFAPTAFGLDEITPAADGVILDYLSFDGQPVRIYFTFDDQGKILQSRCEPSASTSPR